MSKDSLHLRLRFSLASVSVTLFALVTLAFVLMGCQSANPPGPTVAPSASPSITPSPSLTVSAAPSPTLRPIIQATAAINPTNTVVVDAPTAPSAPTPRCIVARAGDTIITLLYRGGYGTYTQALAEEFRALNNMPAGSNNIQAGQTYCVPAPTPTPTQPGHDATATVQARELASLMPQTKVVAITTYVIKKGDTIQSLQIDLGVTLRELCDLNHPDPINCGGCNIDAPIGQQGCRPLLREGATIHIPGPTPTPTITPTLTGSETATPTPSYSAPQILSPAQGQTVTGPVQLVWLPVAILRPDESYLIRLTDATTSVTRQFETQATSYRLPADLMPTDGRTHTINWQLTVAQIAQDGAYVVIGQQSVIYTFLWLGQ